MNKNLYKLIRSKRTHLLVPVAEFTSSEGKPQYVGSEKQASSVLITNVQPPAKMRYLADFIRTLLFVPMLTGAAEIIPDTKTQTEMNKSANDTPVVNIANPNAAGLSHNTYKEFNVSNPGVIFNNSLSNGTSAIGGFVTKNPHLDQSASAILNEVSGGNRSTLEGTLEVFGKKADVIIANPNGISVNGISTINAGQLSLSAGRVSGTSGSSATITTTPGASIDIGEKGVNAQDLSRFDLLAESVNIMGPVVGAKSTDINVTAGAGDFNTQTGAAKNINEAGRTSINAGLLGSMYGNNVRIITTNQGPGVNLEGAVRSVGDVNIDSGSQLKVKQVNATGDVNLTSKDGMVLGAFNTGGTEKNGIQGKNVNIKNKNGFVQVHANVVAEQDITSNVSNLLLNSAKLHSNKGQVIVDVMNQLLIQGTLYVLDSSQLPIPGAKIVTKPGGMLVLDGAGVEISNPIIVSSAGIDSQNSRVKAGTISNDQGQIVGSDGVTVTAEHQLENKGIITSNQQVVVQAEDLLNEVLINSRNASTSITAAKVENKGNINAFNNISTNVSEALINAGAINALKNVLVNAKNLTNNQDAKILASKLALQIEETLNNRGTLISNKETFTSNSKSLLNAGVMGAAGAMTLNSQDIRQEGSISSTLGALTLKAGNKYTSTDSAILESSGALSLNAQHNMQVAGTLTSKNVINIQGENVDNSSKIKGLRDVNLNASGTLVNTGKVESRRFNANAGGDLTNRGELLLRDSATLTGDNISNQGGINARNTVTVNAANTFTNESSVVATTQNITGENINNSGALQANQNISLVANNELNNSGAIQSKSVDTESFSLNNTGKINAKENLGLATLNYYNTGELSSEKNATLTMQEGESLTLDNQRLAPLAQQSLTVNAKDITVNQRVSNPGSVIFNASGNIQNNNAILSGMDVGLHAVGDINTVNKSLIWSGGNMLLSGNNLNVGEDALVESVGDMSIEAKNSVVNDLGSITSGGSMTIDAKELLNRAILSGTVNKSTSKINVYGTDNYVVYRDGRYLTVGIAFVIPDFDNKLMVKRASISAGDTLYINQLDQKDRKGLLHNQGTISASNNIVVDGDIQNESVLQEESLADYIKNNIYIELKAWDTAAAGHPYTSTYTNLSDFMQTWFNSYHDETIFGLYNIRSNDVLGAMQIVQAAIQDENTQITYNQIMAKLLGADWKGVGLDNALNKWNATASKLDEQKLQFYPNTQTTLQAGGNIIHTGGYLKVGENTAKKENQPINVTVGKNTITTMDGTLDANFNLTLDNDPDMQFALTDLLTNDKLYGSSNQIVELLPIEVGVPLVKPLFETKNEYINQNLLYGSEYFMQQIGYQPRKQVMTLGDRYLENQLVKTAIKQQLGVQYWDGDVNSPLLMKTLIDNGAEKRLSLGLEYGKALTPGQISKLEQPIVWYVWSQVEGKTVLMPQLYLPTKMVQDVIAKRKGGGASMSASLVKSDATDIQIGNAQIRGSKQVDLKAKNSVVVSNTGDAMGGIVSDGDIKVGANDIKLSGAMVSGDNVALDAKKDLDISSTMGYSEDGDLTKRTNTGIIGNNIKLLAGDNTNLTAANILATDQLDIKAGKKITSTDVKSASSLSEQDSSINMLGLLGGEINNHQAVVTRSQGSDLVTKKLNIVSGDDTSFTGGTIKSKETILDVGGNLAFIPGATDYFDVVDERSMKINLSLYVQGGGYRTGTDIGFTNKKTGASKAKGNTDPIAALMDLGLGAKSYVTKAGNNDAMVGADFGINFNQSRTESEGTQYQNVNASLGNVTMKVAKTLDIGGLDLNKDAASAKVQGEIPTADITAGNVIDTTYENKESSKTESSSIFVGAKVTGKSSIATVVSRATDTGLQGGMEGKKVDAGMTALQTGGDVLAIVTQDTGEVSGQAGIWANKSSSTTMKKSDNTNTLGGNVSIKSNKDIQLSGVTMAGGNKVELDAANKIDITAAKSTTTSTTESNGGSLYVGASAGANAVQASAGVGSSAGFSYDRQNSNTLDVNYKNASIQAKNIVVKSGGDTTLVGANITGAKVNAQIGGNLSIQDVQDIKDSVSLGGGFSGSIGASMQSGAKSGGIPTGAINPNVNISVNRQTEKGALTAQVSGINANNLALDVAGDVNMVGGKLQADSGKVNVKGDVNTQDVQNYYQKDGFYLGGGGGISVATGLPTANISGGRGARVDKSSVDKSTIDVGQSSGKGSIVVDGNINQLNTDAETARATLKNEEWASNDFSVTAFVPAKETLKTIVSRTKTKVVTTDDIVVPKPKSPTIDEVTTTSTSLKLGNDVEPTPVRVTVKQKVDEVDVPTPKPVTETVSVGLKSEPEPVPVVKIQTPEPETMTVAKKFTLGEDPVVEVKAPAPPVKKAQDAPITGRYVVQQQMKQAQKIVGDINHMTEKQLKSNPKTVSFETPDGPKTVVLKSFKDIEQMDGTLIKAGSTAGAEQYMVVTVKNVNPDPKGIPSYAVAYKTAKNIPSQTKPVTSKAAPDVVDSAGKVNVANKVNIAGEVATTTTPVSRPVNFGDTAEGIGQLSKMLDGVLPSELAKKPLAITINTPEGEVTKTIEGPKDLQTLNGVQVKNKDGSIGTLSLGDGELKATIVKIGEPVEVVVTPVVKESKPLPPVDLDALGPKEGLNKFVSSLGEATEASLVKNPLKVTLNGEEVAIHSMKDAMKLLDGQTVSDPTTSKQYNVAVAQGEDGKISMSYTEKLPEITAAAKVPAKMEDKEVDVTSLMSKIQGMDPSELAANPLSITIHTDKGTETKLIKSYEDFNNLKSSMGRVETDSISAPNKVTLGDGEAGINSLSKALSEIGPKGLEQNPMQVTIKTMDGEMTKVISSLSDLNVLNGVEVIGSDGLVNKLSVTGLGTEMPSITSTITTSRPNDAPDEFIVVPGTYKEVTETADEVVTSSKWKVMAGGSLLPYDYQNLKAITEEERLKAIGNEEKLKEKK